MLVDESVTVLLPPLSPKLPWENGATLQLCAHSIVNERIPTEVPARGNPVVWVQLDRICVAPDLLQEPHLFSICVLTSIHRINVILDVCAIPPTSKPRELLNAVFDDVWDSLMKTSGGKAAIRFGSGIGGIVWVLIFIVTYLITAHYANVPLVLWICCLCFTSREPLVLHLRQTLEKCEVGDFKYAHASSKCKHKSDEYGCPARECYR